MFSILKKMVTRKFLTGLISIFLFVISLNFIIAVHTTTPGSFNPVNQSHTWLYNISVNNTNVLAEGAGNITQVRVILPYGFTFTEASNGASIVTTFTNTSSGTVLTWTNVTDYILLGRNTTTNNTLNIWFNATSPDTIGNYNFTVGSVNESSVTLFYSNVSIRVNDVRAPNVTVVYPLNATNYSTTGIYFNLTVKENYALYTCWFTLNNGITNTTMLPNASGIGYWGYNLSIANGDYVNRFYCNDTSNNINGTTATSFKLDTLAPYVILINPAAYLNLSAKTINFTGTVNDSHAINGANLSGVGVNYVNITIYNSAGTLVNNSLNQTFLNGSINYGNFTNSITFPADGIYTVVATAVDYLGQANATTATTVYVDSATAPTLNITSPINTTSAIYYANKSIILSFVRSDYTPGAMWYNYNGTNSTSSITNSISVPISYNDTGSKNIIFYSNDTFNTLRSTMITINVTTFNSTTSFIPNASSFTVNSSITSVVVPFNSTIQNLTLSNYTQLVTLDLSQIKNSTGIASVGSTNFNLVTIGTSYNYTVFIPANITITGGANWDGKITLPLVNLSTNITQPTLDGYTTSAPSLVLDTGSSVELNFSSPVKIFLGGMAGKRAAWLRGNETLKNIDTVCDSLTNPTIIDPVYARECYRDSGNDLIIWTYHFSSFAAYTATLTTSETPALSNAGSAGSVPEWSSTTILTDKQFSDGYTKELGAGQRVKFKVNTAEHMVGVSSITSSSATIKIESTTQQAVLNIGDVKKFDVNAEGYYDVQVTLNSIANNKASITVKSINEKISAETIEQGQEQISEPIINEGSLAESSSSGIKAVIWVVLIVVIIAVMAFVLFKMFSKKQLRYKKGKFRL